MQVLHLTDGNLSFRTDYPQPQLQPGEALIRVTLAGICTTDLEIVKGYAGFNGVIGHEFVGIVEAVAHETDADWIGKRVVGTINLGCYTCAICLRDGPEHCPTRRVLGIINKDGIFADYVTLPIPNLLAVPDNVADETAVFTEPLAAALRIREQVAVKPTATAAVVGPGRLGLLVGQVLALAGTDVTMLGRRPSTLNLPAQLGLKTALIDQFADDSFDFIVEATGNNDGFAHALRLIRPLGTLILKSTFQGNANLDLTKLVVAEITVIGSRCGPFVPALRLLAQNTVNVQALIAAEYPLREGVAAFAHAAQPGIRKILLRP